MRTIVIGIVAVCLSACAGLTEWANSPGGQAFTATVGAGLPYAARPMPAPFISTSCTTSGVVTNCLSQ